MFSTNKKIFSLIALITYIFSFCAPSIAQEYYDSPDSSYLEQTTPYVEPSVESTTEPEASTTSSDGCEPLCPPTEDSSSQNTENSSDNNSSENNTTEDETHNQTEDSASTDSQSNDNGATDSDTDSSTGMNDGETDSNTSDQTQNLNEPADSSSSQPTETTAQENTAESSNAINDSNNNAAPADVDANAGNQNGGNAGANNIPAAGNQNNGGTTNNQTNTAATVTNPAPAPATNTVDNDVSVSIKDGQIDLPATKARIEAYLRANQTAAAAKLTLAAAQALTATEINSFIVKILAKNDLASATEVIVRALSLRKMNSAQVTGYLNQLLAMGTYKNNEPQAALGEAVIKATIDYPEMVSIPGAIWQKQLLRSSDQVSWQPLINFTNRLAELGEFPRVANILVAQINFYRTATLITDLPKLQAFLTDYLDRFLAIGKYSKNTAVYMDEAEKVITHAVSSSKSMIDQAVVTKYVNHFITKQEFGRAVTILTDAIRSRIITNPAIVDYIHQFMALGKYTKNTPRAENAEQLISASLNSGQSQLTPDQIKSFINQFLKLNETARAVDLIADTIQARSLTNPEIVDYANQFMALGKYTKNTVDAAKAEKIIAAAVNSSTPMLTPAQMKVFINQFLKINDIDRAVRLIIDAIQARSLTNLEIVDYANRFLALGSYTKNTVNADKAEQIISAAVNFQIPMLTPAQIKVYINQFLKLNETDRGVRLIVDTIGAQRLTNAEIVDYADQFMALGKYTKNTVKADKAEQIILAAVNFQIPMLTPAQIKVYINQFLKTNDVDRGVRLIVDTIRARRLTNDEIVDYMNQFMALGKYTKNTVKADKAEQIMVAALNSQPPMLTQAQIKTFIGQFLKLGDIDRAVRMIVDALRTPNYRLIANEDIVDYANQFLALGKYTKNTVDASKAEQIVSAAVSSQPPMITQAQLKVFIDQFLKTGSAAIAKNLISRTWDVPGLYLTPAQFKDYIDQFLAVGKYAKNTAYLAEGESLLLEAMNKSFNASQLARVALVSAVQVRAYLQALYARNSLASSKKIAQRALSLGVLPSAELQKYL